MKRLIILLSVLSLTGCSIFPKEPIVVTKPVLVDRPKLEVADPEPAKQMPFTWTVITKDNFDAKTEELESKGQTVVFFALTPEGYQNLSISVAELRRFIQQQKSVIGVLKEYYEKPIGGESTESTKK